MKGKVKLILVNDGYERNLYLRLKLENQLFYWYKKRVVSNYDVDIDCIKSTEWFYQDVITYVSDINNIKKDGEELMREVLNHKAEDLRNESKEKEAIELLKRLKEPIEIEIKE